MLDRLLRADRGTGHLRNCRKGGRWGDTALPWGAVGSGQNRRGSCHQPGIVHVHRRSQGVRLRRLCTLQRVGPARLELNPIHEGGLRLPSDRFYFATRQFVGNCTSRLPAASRPEDTTRRTGANSCPANWLGWRLADGAAWRWLRTAIRTDMFREPPPRRRTWYE